MCVELGLTSAFAILRAEADSLRWAEPPRCGPARVQGERRFAAAARAREEALIARVRARNVKAFEELYRSVIRGWHAF